MVHRIVFSKLALICLILSCCYSASAQGARPNNAARAQTPFQVLFATVPGFDQPISKSANSDLHDIDPLIPVLKRWTKLSGDTVNWTAFWLAGPNPLEWPAVFKDDQQNSRHLAAQVTSKLDNCGVRYEPLVFDGFGASSDALGRSLAKGRPVLRNAPSLPFYYGFDAREPGTFWYAEIGGAAELLLNEERRKLYWFWDDDPASNLAWSITVNQVEAKDDTESRQFELKSLPSLLAVSTSSDSSVSRISYVPQIRRFIEILDTANRLPELVDSPAISDPLGFHRLSTARRAIASALDELSRMYKDTTRTKPLSRAGFYYDRSATQIDEAIVLFYGFDHQPKMRTDDQGSSHPVFVQTPQFTAVDLFGLEQRWSQAPTREEVANRLQDVLRWEKRAYDEISLYDKKFPDKK